MNKLSSTQPTPEHPFATYVRTLGKGKSGSRSLSCDEAEQAFGMILRGEVEPVQLGAFLMLLRVKEESAGELAGFVQACRKNMLAPPPGLQADLDWSSYAGKKHQHPWFVLSMMLLASVGFRIFVHGSAGHTAGRLYTETVMQTLDLPVAGSWADVSEQLDAENLSYLPLEQFCQPLQQLMQLRPLLGLRSPVNTLTRMINPLAAKASLQSIFHPAYATLHQQADKLLQQPRALVFKGDSGEVEIKPQADTRAHMLIDGELRETSLPRTLAARVQSVEAPAVEPLRQLWRGEVQDDYGLDATLATAAAALLILKPELDWPTAKQEAAQLWRERDCSRLG